MGYSTTRFIEPQRFGKLRVIYVTDVAQYVGLGVHQRPSLRPCVFLLFTPACSTAVRAGYKTVFKLIRLSQITQIFTDDPVKMLFPQIEDAE